MLCLSPVMWQVPQKHRYPSTKLHDVTSKKNYSYNLRMEPADCSGMFVYIYQNTVLHNPEYLSLNISHCGTFTVLTMLGIYVILDHQQQFCNLCFHIWILCSEVLFSAGGALPSRSSLYCISAKRWLQKKQNYCSTCYGRGGDHMVASIYA